MSKLNEALTRKLLACSEEAKEQGMFKLASNIVEAIESECQDESPTYSYSEMEEDVHRNMWKAAMDLAKYWGIDSMDVLKLDNSIRILASEMIDEMEHSLGVDTTSLGPLEDKVLGQS